MPLILETNYSKKIGLPGYSSHQFMVTLRTEITDLNTVPAESRRLYELLQHAVDSSLQNVGWLPESSSRNGNSPQRNGGQSDRWACSEKQRDLILTTIAAAVQGELDRTSQTLTGCIRQLTDRYVTPLPQITGEVTALSARVVGHFKKMGAVWK